VQSELDLGVGWQDPAVIRETGLCVWHSGPAPVLDFKVGAAVAFHGGGGGWWGGGLRLTK
jgi:hypothetical protein